MAILPGWNSLDAAGFIAHSLHIAAMVVLALLVIAEGMVLVYNDHKYALIGAAERDITARRDQEQREAEERHHNEIAARRDQCCRPYHQDPAMQICPVARAYEEA